VAALYRRTLERHQQTKRAKLETQTAQK